MPMRVSTTNMRRAITSALPRLLFTIEKKYILSPLLILKKLNNVRFHKIHRSIFLRSPIGPNDDNSNSLDVGDGLIHGNVVINLVSAHIRWIMICVTQGII